MLMEKKERNGRQSKRIVCEHAGMMEGSTSSSVLNDIQQTESLWPRANSQLLVAGIAQPQLTVRKERWKRKLLSYLLVKRKWQKTQEKKKEKKKLN